MISLRQAAFHIFRPHQLTTVSGNPGSTELPMAADDCQDQIRIALSRGYSPAEASLGSGVPAAIGRRLAEPDRPVVALAMAVRDSLARPGSTLIELPVGGCAGSHR